MVDPITAAVVTGIAVSLVSGIIITLIKRKFKKNDKKDIKKDEEEEIIKDIQKNLWRLNKTVLIMAKMIDDQTEKVHSELNSSLTDIATELLESK